MKRSILLIIALISFIACFSNRNQFNINYRDNQDSTRFLGTVLEGIDVQSFIGKPVEELMDEIDHEPVRNAPDTPDLKALGGWIFEFEDNFFIIISIYDFQYIRDTDYNEAGYDYELFKKEKIGQVVIRDHKNQKVWAYN